VVGLAFNVANGTGGGGAGGVVLTTFFGPQLFSPHTNNTTVNMRPAFVLGLLLLKVALI
jgi:hypothetical protein